MANLLQLVSEEPLAWRPDELEAMLKHQFQAELADDLGVLGPGVATQARYLGAEADPPIRTFGELFAARRPPVKLLDLTKRFAKACNRSRVRAVPRELSSAVYYLSIAAALARCQTAISRLEVGEVRKGLHWLADRTWLNAESRKLAREALAAIEELPGKR